MTDKKPVLSVENLTVKLPDHADRVNAIEEVSFDVRPNEILCVVGESGSGKSVTAHTVMGLLPPKQLKPTAGRILLQGENLFEKSELELREMRGAKMSMIFQEPMTALNPVVTVGDQIEEVLRIHRPSNPKERARLCNEVMEAVNLPEPEKLRKSYPHQLSGGQRQRIMIAAALILEPFLLIADEPTTALDVTIEAQIIDLLLDLQQETGMAMLFISHDLGLVRQIANRVIVMKNGQVIEEGLKQQIFDFPTSEYTRSLVNSKVNMERNWRKKSTAVILETKNINVKFPIRTGLLRRTSDFVHAVIDTSFKLYSGESLGIVGESGSGKSTLARALTKLIPHEGSVYFAGSKIKHKSSSLLKPYRRKVQIVFQDPYGSLSPRLSIREIIAEGPKAHGHKNNLALQKQIDEVLKEVGLESETQLRYPHEFSGGQRQRVAIARALILKPEIIIFDEPTSALDVTIQKQVVELLLKLQKRHSLSYIFISHDISLIGMTCHSMMVMKDGKIVERGTTQEILKNPNDAYTQDLISAANRK